MLITRRFNAAQICDSRSANRFLVSSPAFSVVRRAIFSRFACVDLLFAQYRAWKSCLRGEISCIRRPHALLCHFLAVHFHVERSARRGCRVSTPPRGLVIGDPSSTTLRLVAVTAARKIQQFRRW